MREPIILILSAILIITSGCGGEGGKELGEPVSGLPEYLPRSMDFHIFYYAWYGTPEFDGEYRHWNHAVLAPDGSETGMAFPGGNDIGASFYPKSGCYSSNDPETVARHCFEIRLAGAGAICVSWWGKDSFSDRAVPLLLDTAYRHGLRVDFHIEPFEGRTAATTRDAIVYIIDTYGDHPAFYRTDRFGEKPMFFIYDSYLVEMEQWAAILSPEGENSIRGTKYDSNVIGLLVDENHKDFIIDGGFDGCYTYFVVDGFTWGSTTLNWAEITEWALENEVIFVPCVGPGYNDIRIRPWNVENYRERDAGEAYYTMFVEVHKTQPAFVGITSFNEWHEGTQIEPAVPMSITGFNYEDYSPLPHDAYLHKTRSLFSNFKYTFSH